LVLQGGSWCRNLTVCGQRKKTNLGSSDYMERRVEFVGILSDDELQNPGTLYFSTSAAAAWVCSTGSSIPLFCSSHCSLYNWTQQFSALVILAWSYFWSLYNYPSKYPIWGTSSVYCE
jgi:hypothetical protein